MKVGVIILAAGHGRRMGCPKALARISGNSFLAQVRATVPSHCPVVIVVNDTVAEALSDTRFTEEMVINPSPEKGMVSSVLLGIHSLVGCQDFLLFPVDHPMVQPKTIELLLSAISSETAGKRIIPTFMGMRGHPVIVPQSVQTALEAHPAMPLNEVLREFSIKEIPVNDGGILKNLNHPEQLENEA